MLAPYTLVAVADVRRFPGSRRQPQYQQSTFQAALAGAAIGYCWLWAAGAGSNGAWRHPAFRGYADHTAGEEFAQRAG